MSQQTTNPYMDDGASSPRPLLGEALWQLPRQYIKVLCRPSAQTFREEMDRASWGIVLIQFYMLIVITIALIYLAHLIPSSALHTTSAFSIGSFKLFAFLPSPYNGITFILGSFLIGLGTAYLFSRLWRGEGSFLEHTYSLLLCTVPLVTISGALLLIPTTTSGLVLLLSGLILVAFIYRMALHVCIIMGVHGLSAGKSTLIVLIIPMLVVGLVVIGFLVVSGGEVLGELLGGFEWLPGEGRKHKRR